ncbi:hypothetical protein OQA88_831 [Cercophora sp. LCS_1]
MGVLLFLGPTGLVVDGTPLPPPAKTSASQNFINCNEHLAAPSISNGTIQVYSFTIDRWHPREQGPRDPKPSKPWVGFNWYNTSTGKYWLKIWNTEVKGDPGQQSGLPIGNGQVNTVVTVQGYLS